MKSKRFEIYSGSLTERKQLHEISDIIQVQVSNISSFKIYKIKMRNLRLVLGDTVSKTMHLYLSKNERQII